MRLNAWENCWVNVHAGLGGPKEWVMKGRGGHPSSGLPRVAGLSLPSWEVMWTAEAMAWCCLLGHAAGGWMWP